MLHQSDKRNKIRQREQQVWNAYTNGEEEAFSELYLLFFDKLFVYGSNIVNDETLVKDAIQEIFLKLLQRDSAQLNIKNISSYLFVALRNHLNKEIGVRNNRKLHRKKYSQKHPLFEEQDFRGIEEQLDVTKIIKREIDLLPGRQKEILCLRYFNGLDYKEIAEILSLNHQVTRNYAY